MLQVAALIASLAFLALVVFLIPTLLQAVRTARAAEQTLASVDREIKPLTTQIQALLQEHRTLAQQATRDLRQVESTVLMAQDVLARLTNLTSLLSSFGDRGPRRRRRARPPEGHRCVRSPPGAPPRQGVSHE